MARSLEAYINILVKLGCSVMLEVYADGLRE